MIRVLCLFFEWRSAGWFFMGSNMFVVPVRGFLVFFCEV